MFLIECCVLCTLEWCCFCDERSSFLLHGLFPRYWWVLGRERRVGGSCCCLKGRSGISAGPKSISELFPCFESSHLLLSKALLRSQRLYYCSCWCFVSSRQESCRMTLPQGRWECRWLRVLGNCYRWQYIKNSRRNEALQAAGPEVL